jgi:hypothetical protein
MSEVYQSPGKFNGIVLATKSEAEDVLTNLRALIDIGGSAKVADLLGLVQLKDTYADELWEWTDLTTAEIKEVQGGYTLELPEPVRSEL